MIRGKTLDLGAPSKKQAQFLCDTHKEVGFGGARGGGKSWAIDRKCILLALKWPGIKCMIVRRSYPELKANHIEPMQALLHGYARYNAQDKIMLMPNGSTIRYRYCANDADLLNYQGLECDILCIDEATQITEHMYLVLKACVRGANPYPKRIYITCNPGGVGHQWVKRLFVDRNYQGAEDPDDYSFVQSLVTDNTALMASDPDYIRQLDSLPPKLRDAWRYGSWDVFTGQFFDEWSDHPEYGDRNTHIIKAFAIPQDWQVYRSFDFGYAKPFSCGWWAVDYDGVLYRIAELYGCTDTPNEGVKWAPDKIFREIRQIEEQHPLLAGKRIYGVADPSIWDKSRGDSVYDMACKERVYFEPGDNHRIPGWMQIHYRLQFDANGYPMMYGFDTCKAYRRTMPLMIYDDKKVEDLDTSLEDHCPDEVRYMCMSHPISVKPVEPPAKPADDPLDMYKDSLQGRRASQSRYMRSDTLRRR